MSWPNTETSRIGKPLGIVTGTQVWPLSFDLCSTPAADTAHIGSIGPAGAAGTFVVEGSAVTGDDSTPEDDRSGDEAALDVMEV